MHLPHLTPFTDSPLYFFTASTEGRRRLLACQQAYETLLGIWQRSAGFDGWYVGKFLLMPDHVHFFATPAREAKPRADWHKMWKSVSSRQLRQSCALQPPIWQADTFDHILRNKKSYAEKLDYVLQNPVRQGLTATPQSWPWQGTIHDLSTR